MAKCDAANKLTAPNVFISYRISYRISFYRARASQGESGKLNHVNTHIRMRDHVTSFFSNLFHVYGVLMSMSRGDRSRCNLPLSPCEILWFALSRQTMKFTNYPLPSNATIFTQYTEINSSLAANHVIAMTNQNLTPVALLLQI